MYNSIIRSFAAAVVILVCGAAALHAQDVLLTDSASFSGTGSFNVKGNIIVDSAASAITVTGSTHLVGTSAQTIGAGGSAALTFDQLHLDSASAKTMAVPVTVRKVIALNNGSLVVNGKTLTIDSSSARSNGTLTANGGSDVVVYDGNGAFTQPVIDGSYKKLLLTNSASKVLLDTVSVDTVTHSGGGLGVNHNFTVNHAGSIGTIDSATATLQFNGTQANSIQAVTATAATGHILNNASDSLTINAVNGNAGTISTVGAGLHIATLAANSGTIKTTGAGNIRFAHGAVNSGVISDSGAAGSISFDTTLDNNAAGKVLGGQGGVTFTKKPVNAGTIAADAGTLAFLDSTANSGTIALAVAGQATFAKGVANTGTISAKDSARTTFDENFASAGTLLYTDTSTAVFQGTTTAIPSTKFANLTLTGPNKTASANDSLTGVLALTGSNLTVDTGKSMVILAGSAKVTGSGEVDGSVRRTHAFTAGQYYAFNKDSVGLAIDLNSTPDITVTMIPDSGFSTASPSAKYAKRHYGFAANAIGAAKLSTLSLVYTNAERSAAVTDESKFGVRADEAGHWAKVNNPLGYSRSVDTLGNVILLSSLATPLAGVSEFGIINTAFVTTADNASWAAGTTWDEGTAPTISDDAEINNLNVSVNAPAFAASVTIDPAKSLHLAASTLSVAGLFDLNGSLVVDPTTTLSLSNNLRIHGAVTNNGTINVGQ